MTASSLDPSISGSGPAAGRLALRTLIAGCLAVCLAQIGIAIPATLNGLLGGITGNYGSWRWSFARRLVTLARDAVAVSGLACYGAAG